MNTRSNEVLSSDFLGLRNLCSLMDLSSLCNLTGLNSLYSPISSQNILILIVWSSMVSKWPMPVLFRGMDHQKSKNSLIYGTLSVGGCWGQPMLIFWKLVDETQISQPKEYTDDFKQNLTSIFLSVRAILKETFQCETPCKLAVNIKKWVDINQYKYVCIKLVHACWENWQYALTMQVPFGDTEL